MKKLPIGISDFKEIIEENYYYIDKTDYINEILNGGAKILLLPRPRRFGKTLFINTLRCFFEKTTSRLNLFKNLDIYKSPNFKLHFGKYPVIYLTFKDIKSDNFNSSLKIIYLTINNEFHRHKNLLEKQIDNLTIAEQKIYNKILKNDAEQSDYEQSLRLLSKLLYLAYNKKVVFLLDEYDTPIQTSFIKGFYNQMINFFKPFLGSVLKDNDQYLEKAILTGILRISKESIFSDLNNVKILTMLDDNLSGAFGFTIEEVKRLLKDYKLEKSYDQVMEWYNGYIFGDKTILNPWSVINFADTKKIDVYWANTSSNEIIRTLIENSPTFKKDLETLLNNNYITQIINPNITFTDNKFKFDNETLYSFLFFSGYLKCLEKRFDEGDYICKLAIANKECKYIFNRIIRKWIDESFENAQLKQMLKGLVNGDLKLFERIFSDFVRDTLSYFDTEKRRVEAVYHAFLLGMLVNLREYEIISNKEAGYGRVDIMILHKKDKTKLAIIMELKIIDEFESETKEEALNKAIYQIKNKNYMAETQKKGYKNILALGLVFDGKRVWVKKAI